MSELVQMLTQLAVSTAPQTERENNIDRLADAHQLPAALTEAIKNADLSGLVQLAGAPGRGCFVIVAPDSPDQPDNEDEPEDDVKIRRH